jgi:SAM-dependent methyltransferase
MDDATSPPQQPPPRDRSGWIADIRRRNERLQDELLDTLDYDAHWGEIEDEHRAFVHRFLSMLPDAGTVLDAPCGTGKYFAMVLERGRSLLGVDHSGAMLARAREKFPNVPTEKYDLQDLPYRQAFDGVMCVDALESLPPEDWPVALARFRRALLPGGWLYVTVELSDEGRAAAVNEEARDAGIPVVEGEWSEPDGYYHYYPPVERVRSWMRDAGFAIEDEAEGSWHEESHAYHHVLARLNSSG